MLKPGRYTFHGVHRTVTMPEMHLTIERIDGEEYELRIEGGCYVAVDERGNVTEAYGYSGRWEERE